MPGFLDIRFKGAYGGVTPAKSAYAWLEGALEVTAEEHSAHGLKPYACEARQNGRHVDARLTLATPALIERVLRAVGARQNVFNSEPVEVEIMGSTYLGAAEILDAAPLRSRVQLVSHSPVVIRNSGYDDPVLTKQRLFDAAKRRWVAMEGEEPPVFSSAEDCEVMFHDSRSAPFRGFEQSRGWTGRMDLQFRGAPQRIRHGNALLAYLSMWGMGHSTAIGAGRFEVREVPRAAR